MDKLRLRLRKTGRAIYISHLDLMHTIQRGFARAGYELRYSEGFNPHPAISMALPLSLGTASECEIMDFRLKSDVVLEELPARLTAALPEGIEIIEAYESERKAALIKWLAVEGRFAYDTVSAADVIPALRAFFERESIAILKRTKRGEGESDIKSAIRSVSFESAAEGEVRVSAVISAQEPTLNPDLLANALRQLAPELAPDFAAFTRIETYDADMKVFR